MRVGEVEGREKHVWAEKKEGGREKNYMDGCQLQRCIR